MIETERPSAWQLMTAFSWVAFESIGGGLGAWVRRLVVAERRWLDEEEYLSAATLCEVLPGSNQLNMAVFVGARVNGAWGALGAVAGLLVLPAVVAILAGAALIEIRDIPLVRNVLGGMSSAAAGLTLSVAWRQASSVLSSVFSVCLAMLTILLLRVAHLPLWLVLPLCGALGCYRAWHSQRR